MTMLTLRHEEGLGRYFASALGSASGLGHRVATRRGLGGMLHAILAWSTVVTFDMGSLAACAGRHRQRHVVVVGRGRGRGLN